MANHVYVSGPTVCRWPPRLLEILFINELFLFCEFEKTWHWFLIGTGLFVKWRHVSAISKCQILKRRTQIFVGCCTSHG